MATTSLSDIIDVTIFQDLAAVNSPELSAFYESGVVVGSPLLDQLANGPGKKSELPFWNDIDAAIEANLSSDDPAAIGSVQAINQGEQESRKAFLNKGMSSSDLASELAQGPKAMEHIRARIDTYWTRQFQRRLIASCDGVIADNVANNSGDMVHDVAADDTANQTAATRWSRSNFTSAAFTLGDAFNNTGAMAVHSAVYKQMVDADDVDFIPDSEGKMVIPTFMGKRVIVDDSMTVTAGSASGFKYTTVLFGAGSFGLGNGTPDYPVEIERAEAGGNGGGIGTLWTRKTYLLHPLGFKNTGTPADDSYSIAELKLAATWSRVVDRKLVPMAFLVTN
jgi:hypothetical protein